LKQVAPGLLPAGYDYTTSPDSRPAVQAQIFEKWSQETSAAAGDKSLPLHTLVRSNDSKAMQDGFQRLLRQRDQRPVRLRE
jgi:hypothetical protein